MRATPVGAGLAFTIAAGLFYADGKRGKLFFQLITTAFRANSPLFAACRLQKLRNCTALAAFILKYWHNLSSLH